MVVTTDNAGAIGEKPQDVVSVSNELAAYFTTRVNLLEQWAAGAEPELILLSNFSGDASWDSYVKGISQVFDEIGQPSPQIQGSTESNMPTLQSGIAISMIGNRIREDDNEDLHWFAYGKPLVGHEVLEHADAVANLGVVYKGIQKGIVERVWPVGSKGIAAECARIFPNTTIGLALPLNKTAGPSTVVLIGVKQENVAQAQNLFGQFFEKLIIK